MAAARALRFPVVPFHLQLLCCMEWLFLMMKSSSSESLSDKGSELKKSFDAVVFDVLKVTPEEYAGQITLMDVPVFKAIQPDKALTHLQGFLPLSFQVVDGIKRKNTVLHQMRLPLQEDLIMRVLGNLKVANYKGSYRESFIFKVSFWVVREILHAQTLKIRAEVLSHYIKTAKLLSRKDKTTFEKLEYVMSKEDNYKRLRDYISSLKMTPCIPYLVYKP
ncbi:hypothetical protein EI555_003256 [Monodon monoceros]|uniref:Ras-GEF domain-containing protein n=1 Tax=Monodon monoceros TaxID=40151 RepID=A0A4U1EU87_MONMO|nr:hypothetical protein EI555_003256 [Monodon monoceros]